MLKLLLPLLVATSLFLGGCADFGDEPDEHPPAGYSPDPSGHIPQRQTDPSGAGTPRY